MNKDDLPPLIALAVVCTIFILQIVFVGRRSRTVLEKWAVENDIWIIEMDYRFLRRGPFFWTVFVRYQRVYRVTVADKNGSKRRGWVRLGGLFFGPLFSDDVEVRWDE